MTRKTVAFVILAVLTLGLVLGFWIGWKVYDHKKEGSGAYSGPSAHADGSVTLERKPDSTTVLGTAIPRGDKPVKIIKIRVRDTVRVVIHVRDTDIVCPPCDEIPLDLTISTGKDGDHVTAKAPAGVLITGTDIPITAAEPPRPHKWRVGLAVEPFHRQGGATVMRDAGPFFFGATGLYGASGGAGVISVGINF